MPSFSKAFSGLPPYALADIPKIKSELRERGIDVIDLGAGDADLAPPREAVQAMQEAVEEARFSRYPFQMGLREFREKIVEWMGRRFDVELDPLDEILPLIGTKEGIAHIPLVYLDPGDVAIVPDPGYYPYFGGAHMAGADVVGVPLRADRGFLMDWDEVSAEQLRRAKFLYLNYPNNPTGAVATDEYLRRAVEFCHEHDLLLIFDNAYSEIAFDGYRPPSILQFENARDVALEYHSLSKTYNMTGWRVGWVAGHAPAVRALSRLKTFFDTGVFLGCQAAGVAALDAWERFTPENVRTFQARRDAAVKGFREAGFEVQSPRATMYLWVPIPADEPSVDFCRRVLKQTGVVLFPGAGLGRGGEGFFRVAFSQSPERLAEAATRVAGAL